MRDDFKTAIRSLRTSPTFTAVALIVLALGIGAGTAVFSVADAVVLRGLPFDEHDRLAAVLEHDTKRPTTFGGGSTTSQNFLDWRAQQQSFEALTAVASTGFTLHNENGEPASTRGLRISWEFFPVLRVAPVLGRTFTADDEIDGRHRVAILSHGFWQRRFGGSPDAIGKTIELSEQSWEVVGVMPRGFEYPVASERPTEIYVPLSFRQEDKVRGGSRNFSYSAIGRLKPGVRLPQAQDQMNAVMASIETQHPKWSPGQRTRVITLHEHLVGKFRSWMLMLLAAVAFVLLIACANVANLMLARATTRSREMGIRAALGATRWRLVRGLLVEGLVLSLAGAAIGILLAYISVGVIRTWLPPGLPRVASIGLDLRVLVTAVLAAVTTGIFFGIVPAFHSSRPDLTAALKDSGRSTTASATSQRLRGLLVVAEVALAVVLLVGAGLFISSFLKLTRIDPGFDYSNVLVLDVGPRFQQGKWQEAIKQGRAYAERMLAAVSAVPGVEGAAALSGGLPLTGSWSRANVELPGKGPLEGHDDSVDRRTVTPNYLEVMRIPLKRGRNLTAEDGPGGMPVALINEAAARKYWPGQEALGQRIILAKKEITVVGVIGDIRHLGPETPARQELYVPLSQDEVLSVTLVMRTAGDPLQTLPAVKAAIWGVEKEQRLTADTVTLQAYMDKLLAQRRFNMALLVLFGSLGLVIAAVGIYGVMAYIVAQRTSEIGVRMALGATRGNVVRMVLRRAALLLFAGLGVGAAGAWFLTRHVETFLFQIQPHDPKVYAAAILTLAVAGLVASGIPARRAAAVDPLVALRQD